MLTLLLISTILNLLMGVEPVHLPFQKVPTIIVNHDHSEITQSLVQMISDNRTFDVIACMDEEDDLRGVFYYNRTLVDIMIPEHSSEDLLDSREAEVMILNDGVISAIANGTRGAAAEALGVIKSGYMPKLAEGKSILPRAAMGLVVPMGYMTKAISNPFKSMAYMMMEDILFTVVQIGAGCVGVRVYERVSFGSLMKRAGFTTGIAYVSALGHMVTQTLYSGSPHKSSPWAGILMTVFICFGITLFGIPQNLGIGKNCEEAAQKCSIISSTVLLADYTSPVVSMSWPCKSLIWFIPNTHYTVPLRDMALVERNFSNEVHHVLWLIGFCVVMALLVTKKSRDVRMEVGSPLTDSPLTESGVVGI